MNQTLNREIFSKEDLVRTYLSSEAVEDGFLFDLDQVVKQSSGQICIPVHHNKSFSKRLLEPRANNQYPQPTRST